MIFASDPKLDPWETRIVKIFVTIFMQINLTNIHPQGAWERARKTTQQSFRAPNATKENKSISRKASNFSIAWFGRKAKTENIIIKYDLYDLSDFKIGQRDVLRINFAVGKSQPRLTFVSGRGERLSTIDSIWSERLADARSNGEWEIWREIKIAIVIDSQLSQQIEAKIKWKRSFKNKSDLKWFVAFMFR